MGDHGGRNQDPAVEVGEQELGTCLGAVEADDAEVLRTDLLHARMEHAAGFANRSERSA